MASTGERIFQKNVPGQVVFDLYPPGAHLSLRSAGQRSRFGS